ncbi:peptide chain release factor N(5)-glutamine methyltransferase [Photobacterium ganghwense]|uniref:Release factor glutamine methyltransferase n=1 Tax=Photobacterium ganghwense TaxID=320778 RepID=A0A0J1GYJ3_9GAMM|nr:peptide chain release factor N(5)-glutamine methyltransferase [Photobacterium ganghwense]KLV04690.1 SAM-dependent methyltransferase [Photobacterium ganghwense]PSU05724.1 peptide chain release factor N(5)-glutamine methyltransferase [Photobacterium ganghwense]QSV14735.1 peptide chain release factor N(5)-glutamine methyltransferase [Photobacterium ganghwense]
MQRSIDALLKQAASALSDAGSDSPHIDAAVLLCHVLDKPRSYLLTWPEKELDDSQLSAFNALLARRLTGEPIAYIVGEREFWSLPLKVAPHTLIPRPDTERLVELALDKMPPQACTVLDLGTGTGAIALAIASECPQAQVTGIDLRPEAAALAEENRIRLGIANARFLSGSWYSPLDSQERFAVIVSNPPYIDATDPHLDQGDVRFEPKSALVADDEGLADIRIISEQGRLHLNAGGWLLLEHGYEQGQAVREILTSLGYQQVSTAQDYAGLDRVTLGCWQG